MKLESILIDTKNNKFEINGESIEGCTSFSLTFHEGEWCVATQNKYYGTQPLLKE